MWNRRLASARVLASQGPVPDTAGLALPRGGCTPQRCLRSRRTPRLRVPSIRSSPSSSLTRPRRTASSSCSGSPGHSRRPCDRTRPPRPPDPSAARTRETRPGRVPAVQLVRPHRPDARGAHLQRRRRGDARGVRPESALSWQTAILTFDSKVTVREAAAISLARRRHPCSWNRESAAR